MRCGGDSTCTRCSLMLPVAKPKRVPLSCGWWPGSAVSRGCRGSAEQRSAAREAAAAAGPRGKHWVTSEPASQLARGLIRQALEPCLGTEHAAGDAQPRTDPAQTSGDATQFCGADSELLPPEPGCHRHCTLPA